MVVGRRGEKKMSHFTGNNIFSVHHWRLNDRVLVISFWYHISTKYILIHHVPVPLPHNFFYSTRFPWIDTFTSQGQKNNTVNNNFPKTNLICSWLVNALDVRAQDTCLATSLGFWVFCSWPVKNGPSTASFPSPSYHSKVLPHNLFFNRANQSQATVFRTFLTR